MYSKVVSIAIAIIVSSPHVNESGVKVNSGIVLQRTVMSIVSEALHPAESSI